MQNEIAHPDTVVSPSGSSPAWLHAVVTGVAILAAYIALEWISFIQDYKGLPVTPWNLGLGVVFALMLYSGARFGIVLIAEIAVLRTNLPWPFMIGGATVIDNGAGIAPALAERLFKPLTTSKRDGLGLGLSICATIVQSHHGRLWLQSGAPGATEFRFWLPLERATNA